LALLGRNLEGVMKRMCFVKLAAAVFLGLVQGAAAAAADLGGMGVVLIHGKAGGTGGISVVASRLTAEGAAVTMPMMSWTRAYRTYEETLQEIDAQVAALRARGATRIVLAGHSLGANVALGYAAQRGGVFAVVAMAPGHRPERFAQRTAESLRQAKAMVASGQGNQIGSFVDVNQGDVYQVRTTAAAYVSFFDPGGQAVISRNAARARVPILWVIGTGDRGAQDLGGGGGRSRKVMVSAGHRDTPQAGAQDIVAWLKSL
jgi:pimeloyl-ACP methyl ester carboxylesterase